MAKMVNKTVLIDDSDIDLFIQRRFLEVYNFSDQLISYKSAVEALNWLRNSNGETPPDIIFLDLNMPEVDGFGFLKSFDTLPDKIKTKSRIVVLTSSNSMKDREQVFENKSVIQFITKPLKQADIEELQRKLAANRQPPVMNGSN
ncbi:response regulator [Fulvivirgaceae bacterium PWU4]|jgi:CheY-like chemotaxis protein|uniref:Response regulator n=1 Tax=Chryseosolibacter histidini TaxID=2782349 RepID=A0AAP2DI27_9BACT|nr:response regulator [Chryseosolibacter histidini]MBT1695773.1 response regulator [Chryseosolibacter histidini]